MGWAAKRLHAVCVFVPRFQLVAQGFCVSIWKNLTLTSSPVFGSFVFIAGSLGTSLALFFTRVGMEIGSSLANEELKVRFIENHPIFMQ